MSENRLNRKVKDWINTIPGAWAYKRRGGVGNRGMPDISGCLFSIRIEMEGKLPGNKPTRLQQYFLDLFQKQGCISGWYTSFEEAQAILIEQALSHGIRIEKYGKIWHVVRLEEK